MTLQNILWELVNEVKTDKPDDMMSSVWDETAVKVAQQKIKELFLQILTEGQHE